MASRPAANIIAETISKEARRERVCWCALRLSLPCEMQQGVCELRSLQQPIDTRLGN
jgi:hypothetical protein